MTFELWLYAVKKMAQTFDTVIIIFNQFPGERQDELRKELEMEYIVTE